MTRSLLPIVAALIFPFALLLFVSVVPLVSLVLLARAAPPGPPLLLPLSPRPFAGRSPPFL